MDEWTDSPTDGTDGWTEGRTDGADGQTNKRSDGGTNRVMDGGVEGRDERTDGRMDRQMDEWTVGRRNGRTDRQRGIGAVFRGVLAGIGGYWGVLADNFKRGQSSRS